LARDNIDISLLQVDNPDITNCRSYGKTKTRKMMIRMKQEQQIIELYMTIVAFHQEHTLDCWQDMTNMMMEKVKGKQWIHKMRVIHLFEAAMNKAVAFF
jgi:hypothetical protein